MRCIFLQQRQLLILENNENKFVRIDSYFRVKNNKDMEESQGFLVRLVKFLIDSSFYVGVSL